MRSRRDLRQPPVRRLREARRGSRTPLRRTDPLVRVRAGQQKEADRDEGEDAVDLVELREVVQEELRDPEPKQDETAVPQLTDVADEPDDDRDQTQPCPECA